MQNVQIGAIARPNMPEIAGIAEVVVDERGTLVWFAMNNGKVTVGCPSSPEVTAMLLLMPDQSMSFMPLDLAPQGAVVAGYDEDRIADLSAQIFDEFFPAVGGQA